ncbi:MAG: Na+/H+ antiporter subunit C [Bacteroidales bacterium]
MDILLAIVVGLLYGTALFMILQKSMVKVIIGVLVLGHASNLFIFVIARLTRGAPALVPDGLEHVPEPFADPLPQALILTAIVIGFGIQAFAIVLLQRVYKTSGTSDIDELNNTDRIEVTG